MKRTGKTSGRGGSPRRRNAASRKRPVATKPRAGRQAADAGLPEQLEQKTRALNEALAQQAATADVLKVISRATFDLQAVFDTLTESAIRLCQADKGAIFLRDGDLYRIAAIHGFSPQARQYALEHPIPAGRGTLVGRVALTGKVNQIPDVLADTEYQGAGFQKAFGFRTNLGVPLLRDGAVIGVFSMTCDEVRPFTDKQIELVAMFAAQAVIAIENTRLLNELRQSLERQAATADVLKVISRSTFDLQTVLDTLVESAVRLCRAERSAIRLARDGLYYNVANYGFSPEHKARMEREPLSTEHSVVGRVMATGRSVHLVDAQSDPDSEIARRSRSGNIRSMLVVPLLREQTPIGVLFLQRTVVQPFTDQEIGLAETFADQAGIAIENVRLFEAEQRRTAELTESLEQQTATSEVLQVISSSPGALGPVFDAMLRNAMRICAAGLGMLYRYDGNAFVLAAHGGTSPAIVELMKGGPIHPHPDSVLGRIVATREIVNVADATKDPGYLNRVPAWVVGVEGDGTRSLLGVPMMKENTLIGALLVFRQEAQPFTGKQVELLTNFAAQAVIAIENTRLLSELRESLEQQTATADVLRVISSSPGDLEPVFATMLQNAARVCDAKSGNIFRWDGEFFHHVAAHNTPAAFGEARRLVATYRPDPITPLGRVLASKSVIHIADLAADEAHLEARHPRIVQAVELGSVHTALVVPMLKDGEVIGAFTMNREEVRLFSERQIELVSTFADQAVIAIENTRLLNELRQRTADLTESLEQQTATADVLRVISSSPGNLEPIFGALLEKATKICDANFGNMFVVEGDAYRAVAMHNAPEAYAKRRMTGLIRRPPHETGLGSVMATKQVGHVPDITALPTYLNRDPFMVFGVETAGIRTLLAVPMLRDNDLLGAIVIYRKEVRPFTDKQIALLQNFAAQAAIAIENARLLNELRQRTADLTESLEQQTATSEVLRVISSSPGELAPVFEAMLANALRICDAKFGMMLRYDGDGFDLAADAGSPPELLEFIRQRGRQFQPVPGSHLERVVQTKRVSHTADYAADAPQGPPARFGGARSTVDVPMLKDGALVGVISIYRQEVRPFSDKQIELVQNFAAQAVIAIENTRLLSELRESLEQQTAISEVLGVISSSPGDLKPVFDTILENATRICEASFGNLELNENGLFRLGAAYNQPQAFIEQRQRNPLINPHPLSGLAHVVATKRVFQIEDMAEHPLYKAHNYPPYAYFVETAGARTLLIVPLLKEDELVGVMGIYRQKVLPFTDKQIELVKNFAAQAVIAIENTRLLSELRQSLEQQTATADVLRVISSSPGELEPVFAAMLENATRICEAKYGMLWLSEGDGFRSVAVHGVPPALAATRSSEFIVHFGAESPFGRLVATRQVVHVADIRTEPAYVSGFRPLIELAEVGGARTLLVVPMLKESVLVGTIAIYRQEVRPYSDKQIELVQNFASQAVIAIENTRLLNELRQSLEQQTATADVLRVISSSPGELDPVFQAMLENATRICDAKFGIMFKFVDGLFHAIATLGVPPAFAENLSIPRAPTPLGALGRVTATKQTLHITDVRADPAYAEGDVQRRATVDLGGARSMVTVPMLKDNELVGAMGIYRQEVRPFTDKQIELVQNFAAQAVIAIENTRLLSELRQSLEQQTATSEVLQVISSSPGDLQPVFATMLANIVRVCNATLGAVYQVEDGEFRFVAMHNTLPEYAQAARHTPFQPGPKHWFARMIETKAVDHVADMAAMEGYRERRPEYVSAVDIGRVRTALFIPMLKDNVLIGAFALARQEVRLFSDKQVELVQNFAAQAVIAIENARLLSELRQSLEQQTATADVLRVISSSPGELAPVFQTMLEKATQICEAKFATLFLFDGSEFDFAAQFGTSLELVEFLKQRGKFQVVSGSELDRVLRTRKACHTIDDAAVSVPGNAAKLGGARSTIRVPMLKDDALVGAIVIYRQEVRPFSDKQIELVQNFAAQAVIAIENTRLLNELRQSLEQQTATADVLRVISSSPGDLEPVFQAMLENATRICDATFGNIYRWDGEVLHLVAGHNTPPAFAEARRRAPIRPGPNPLIDRMVATKAPIHLHDAATESGYLERSDPGAVQAVELGGVRTVLAVPMLKDDELVGSFSLYRQEPRPFTDKQIALVTGFANQAVIAIENTRLLNELRQRTDDLSKSLEDLRTAQDRLVQTEKLASLGQLTAGIAHEIKNPLNFVNNFSSLSVELIDELQEELGKIKADDAARDAITDVAETLKGNLEKIAQHGKRADAIVKNMLLHSREGSGERRPVDVNALVEESLNLAYHGARAEKQGFNIVLERSFDAEAGAVDLYPQEVTRVLLNIIANGFYAAHRRKSQADGADFEPTLVASTRNLGDRVEIRIRDNGTGIPPEVKEKIFNPFFTTKPAGEGTGLGLSISHDIIVKQHAGTIAVDTQAGQFTEFTIVLPRKAAGSGGIKERA